MYTIRTDYRDETVIEKSRFICTLKKVSSETEAQDFNAPPCPASAVFPPLCLPSCRPAAPKYNLFYIIACFGRFVNAARARKAMRGRLAKEVAE